VSASLKEVVLMYFHLPHWFLS